MDRDVFMAWLTREFDAEPQHLWEKYPNYAVFRHGADGKWFALVMTVGRDKLGLIGEGTIDVVDLKEDPGLIDDLVRRDGFFRGYHMNKQDWVSVALDGTVPDDQIESLVRESFALTA